MSRYDQEKAGPAQENNSRLANFPINIFAVIMGLGGFAIATHKMEKITGLTHTASTAAIGLAAGIFAIFLAIYTIKLLRWPGEVKKEWNHPIKLSFFPAVSISMLILAICFLSVNRQVSFYLWAAGAILQLVTAISVIRYWIRESHFKEPHLNPAWFIPAVGNVLVPIAGMAHGYPETSWFFFSFGMLFWLILQTIIFNRLIFHTPLPERLLPTLFILIAPPAVGFLSYNLLVGARAVDGFAHFLYYAGLLYFILLASKINILARLQFALSWWAYSFPMAALTLATFRFFELSGNDMFRLAGLALYGLLALIIAILIINTLLAMAGRKICVPE